MTATTTPTTTPDPTVLVTDTTRFRVASVTKTDRVPGS
jgi:hypothetical protein